MRLAAALGLILLARSAAAGQAPAPLPPIDTDRPDLTDGTGTLARGHVQFESGFTLLESRDRLHSWSVPELLVRYGIAPRAELRFGDTFRSIETVPGTRIHGLDDVQVGTKIRIADQHTLPAVSVEVFTSLTTGAAGISAGRMLPGAALLFQAGSDGPWSGGVELEAARGTGSSWSDFASLSIQYQAGKRLQAYGEWYVMQPDGIDGVSQHYLDSGVLYLLSNDLQVDARVGAGVNHDADRFYLGIGLAVRR